MSGVVRRSAAELLDVAAGLTPSERRAYLDEQCGLDRGLRDEVESLLASLHAADGFLSRDPFDRPIDEAGSWGTLPPGTRVSRYQVERVLGQGGMGIVYLARQDNPQRQVALKVLRPSAAGPELLRRFRREAQLLGRLQHPGIAQIFEAGSADLGGGTLQPFLAMEFVRGRPLTEHAAVHHLDARARLALVASVCDAVEHAHQRGLLHRDLKPANILVDESGQTRVLDFGVARAIDPAVTMATLATDAGQLVGTLSYMSPEQVEGDPQALDARFDVYALGIILYELITGQLPFDLRDKMILDAARTIREQEPTRPSRIDRTLRGDAETIVLKALEKDRTRRYPSAAAMAEDIRRFLAGEPIHARLDSALYLLQKRLRRYRWAVAAGLIFVLLLFSFAVWSTMQGRAMAQLARSEAAAKADALEHERTAERRLRAANIERGRLRGLAGDLEAAEDLLWPALAEDPTAADGHWALWELYARFSVARTLGGHSAGVRCVRFSPDGTRLASVGADGVVNMWDAASGANLWTRQGHRDRINHCRFTPDGRLLASAGLDSVIRLWNTRDGTPAGELASHRGSVAEIDISPDGKRFVSAGEDSTLRVWDLRSLRELERLPGTGTMLWSVALDPTGRFAAAGDNSGAIQVWDIDEGRLVRTVQAHTRAILEICYRPDGAALASSSSDGTIALWSAADGSLIRRADGPAHTPRSIAFSPDQTTLVATCTFSTVLLDATTLRPLDPAMPELQGGWSAAFAPDSRTLATTASLPATIRLWSLPLARPYSTLRLDAAPIMAATADGLRLITGTAEEISILKLPALTPERRWNIGTRVRALAVGPGDRALAVATADGRPRVYDLATGNLILETPTRHQTGARSIAFLDGGRKLVTTGTDSTVRIWDASTGEQLATLQSDIDEFLGMAVSPDERWIVATGRDATLKVWDARSYEPRATITGLSTGFWNPSFSPDSRHVIASSFAGTIGIWEPFSAPPTGRELPGHTRFVECAVFSPDGSMICSAGEDGTIRLWNTPSGDCLATLRGCGGLATGALWVPARDAVAVSYSSGDLELWDLGFADRLIAGNAPFQIERLRSDPATALIADRLAAWAAVPGNARQLPASLGTSP